jgi:CheY-like chemotaxis protein
VSVEHETILLVEDEDDLRETIREVIAEEGYHVAEAENGAAALAFLEKSPAPCLVLLDLMMPVVNGFELLERMRADPRWKDIPVLVISALARQRLEETVAKGTAVGYLTKPLQLKALLGAVEQYC